MCLGIPMQVIEQDTPFSARCRHGDSETRVDLSLVGRVDPGNWLLVFTGAAREVLAPARAAEILDALAALEAALDGRYDPMQAFADLDREPQLPPHLQAELAAQRK